MNELPSFVNGKFILCIYSGVLYVVGPCATASALKHQCTGTGQVQPIVGIAYHRHLITNIFTSSLFAGNVHTSGLLWLYPNGDIVFRDQECRVFKEKGRKVDSSDWDFEEPQVRMVKCTVCKKEIMVVLSLLYCKKRLLNMNLIDSMWRFISQQIFCLRNLNDPGIVYSGHRFESAQSKRKGCKSKALLSFQRKKTNSNVRFLLQWSLTQPSGRRDQSLPSTAKLSAM